jgi:hypothetical protein
MTNFERVASILGPSTISNLPVGCQQFLRYFQEGCLINLPKGNPLVQGQYVSVRFIHVRYVSVCDILAFYVPVCSIPEVRGTYSGLGLVGLNAQPIHGLGKFCCCD